MILRYATLVMLLASVAWLTHAPDWEPAIALIATLTAFVGMDIVAQRKGADAKERMHADRTTFSRVRETLHSGGVIQFMREHDFGDLYESKETEPIRKFHLFSESPESVFLSNEIESVKRRLFDAIEAFRKAESQLVFSSRLADQPEIVGIPKEWNTPEHGRRFEIARSSLNNLAEDVCKRYDEFVLKGRKLLCLP